MAYGTVNAEQMTTQSGYTLGAGNASSLKNRIINGGMNVDQRNNGASVTITANDTYTLDRWSAGNPGASPSKMSIQQSTTAPAGFVNSMLVTSLTALSVSSGDFFSVYQWIEGNNISDLSFGSASAKSITVSFWVRSSLTGQFGGALQNSDRSRSYPFSYTINAANTWEQKSISLTGDTSGTWLTSNGKGISVVFGLAIGSTYLTTANAWASGNYWSSTGSTNLLATNGATWYVTGVQLEVGTVATSFDYRPYGTELSLCQRYYYLMSAASNSNTFFHNVAADGTTHALGVVTFPQVMRASPSLTTSGTGSNYRIYMGGAFTTCNAVPAIDQSCPYSSNVGYSVTAGLVTGQGGCAASASSTAAILGFGAEL